MLSRASLRKFAFAFIAATPLVMASMGPADARGVHGGYGGHLGGAHWHGGHWGGSHWGGGWAGFGTGLAVGTILAGPYYGYYAPYYYPYAYAPVCQIHRRVVVHRGHRHVYRYRVCY